MPCKTRTRRARLLPLMVLGLVLSSGCITGPHDAARALFADSTRTSATAEKLLPGHRRILTDSGWFEYVSSNADAVEYYNWDAFAWSTGPALGMATYDEGKRIIRVALKGRADLEVAATLVHEAAHLSGITQVGDLYGEAIATAVEQKFRQDCATMTAEVRLPR
jgi:hypothetical protein